MSNLKLPVRTCVACPSKASAVLHVMKLQGSGNWDDAHCAGTNFTHTLSHNRLHVLFPCDLAGQCSVRVSVCETNPPVKFEFPLLGGHHMAHTINAFRSA